MPFSIKGKAKVGGLVGPLGLRHRRRAGYPTSLDRKNVDRVGRFHGYNELLVVRREPNLTWGAAECRRVHAAVKIPCREPAGVAVQEGAGTARRIDRLGGVGKQTDFATWPKLKTRDIGAGATNGVEAGTASVKHVKQVPIHGQTVGKQTAREDPVYE